MTPAEFKTIAENHIYKEVAKNTNLILGKNKTASLTTGLFLKLPIEVTLEKSHKPIPTLVKELKSFLEYFGAYVSFGNSAVVNMTFLYHTEKDLDALARHLDRHNVFYAFVYLHEVQHILRKHNTSSYERLMTNIAKDVAFPHEIINIAEDHAINYSLKDLFTISKVASHWSEIEETCRYDSAYHTAQLSDIDILKDLIKKNPPMTKTQLSDLLSQVTMNGKSSVQPTNPGGTGKGDDESSDSSKPSKIGTEQDDIDISMSDLAASMQEIIASNTKGSKAGDLFEQLFDSIKVETGWFKKIKASFKRQVYYKTHDYSTNWANLNNTYRRIYKAPKKVFVDTKINIVLSVDHSGSMSTEDLQKLLYLVESESNRIASLKVLIHDTRVIKEFLIEDDYDIANNPEFKQALATRYTSGGTSHACVFEHIQASKIPDPNLVIYMSFSDNCSDIEQCFSNYPVMRKLTNYWICAGANNPVKVPGTNIMMV